MQPSYSLLSDYSVACKI